MRDLIRKPEAAQILGVSIRTLEKMVARGAIPAYKVGPKLVRLDRGDLERYLDGHRAAPVMEKPAAPARPCRYVPGMDVV